MLDSIGIHHRHVRKIRSLSECWFCQWEGWGECGGKRGNAGETGLFPAGLLEPLITSALPVQDAKAQTALLQDCSPPRRAAGARQEWQS